MKNPLMPDDRLAALHRALDRIRVAPAYQADKWFVSPLNFAIIYTGLGDHDQAFAWLERGVEQRTRLLYRVKSRPIFDPLRADSRYAELLRKMNLEP